jgi:hypothetical protein
LDKKTFFYDVEKFPNCTEVRFASFLSGGFTTMVVINPPKKKLTKRTFVLWVDSLAFDSFKGLINS